MNRIPSSTYRLQLSDECNFAAILDKLDYFQNLGVSDLYLSPLFRSRESSTHGYDVVSHTEIEPTIGDLEGFRQLAQEVRRRRMGIIVDVVPNHMGINDPQNLWWLDVLANGPLSRFSTFFDIDWDRSDEQLRNKLLLPLLGDYFGEVLERGELKLAYADGRFLLNYGSLKFPINAFSNIDVLTMAIDEFAANLDGESREEFASIITQLKNLPRRDVEDESASHEREREQTVAAQRLATLTKNAPIVERSIQGAVSTFNGEPGVPASFDRLEKLLAAQWYRLAFWRVAADEINYRRFFDVNDLAAIRVELPQVFTHVHGLLFELLEHDCITGLRIDHPDGLYDPQLYLESLQKRYRECLTERSESDELYIVVEKILSERESLPTSWPVAGTTGYELLNQLSQILVDSDGLPLLRKSFEEFIGQRRPAADVLYESKRQILHDALASELAMLAARLHRIAQSRRQSRDFTFPSLLRGLREVIACFPVYRTYVRSQGWELEANDLGRIGLAVRFVKRRNPSMPRAVFDFISAVLTLSFPPTLSRQGQEAWREFTLRFQQVTGPVTAKGVEDTSFYRYLPLTSLNEVGGEVNLPSLQLPEFHNLMNSRRDSWPHGMSTTATHDTKRGEDTRARLHVISEVPDEWNEFLLEWDRLAFSVIRDVDGQLAPDAVERYLLLQTLVGTWPRSLEDAAWKKYSDRISEYMTKAMREAKRNTSWLDPSPDYEAAVTSFIVEALDQGRSPRLISLVDSFVQRIAQAGYWNSLSQLALKATLPGVPDFYQGTEVWDFSLVDPDNRRPVDFDERQRMLNEMLAEYKMDPAAYVLRFENDWSHSPIKLFATWQLLSMRQQFSELFANGSYLPLEVGGEFATHIIAFARLRERESVLVVVPRCMQRLLQDAGQSHINWRDTFVRVPNGLGKSFCSLTAGSSKELVLDCKLKVSIALKSFPFAVLLSE